MVDVNNVPEPIRSGVVIVYGKAPCRYCDLAIDLASRKGLTIDYRSLTNPEHFRFIVEERGYRTVPQIWVSDSDGLPRYIGGYTEFNKLYDFGDKE